MPNNCENRVVITGPKDDISRLWDVIKTDEEHEARLTNLLPMPDELRTNSVEFSSDVEEQAKAEMLRAEMLKKYGSRDWYDWANNNWGTKWGDYDYFNAYCEGDTIDLGFFTAWCTFHDFFWEKVSRQYPTLTFCVVYDEPGMDFMGCARYKAGRTEFRYQIEEVHSIVGQPDWDDTSSVDDWYGKRDELREQMDELSKHGQSA